MLRDLILKNRSYRRFHEDIKISEEQLLAWIDLARHCASGRNNQPIKYILSCAEKKNEKIFPHLSWAGALKDWDRPEPGERPVAYVIQLLDTEISNQHYCDDGIAAQSILLGAVEAGFGGCIFRAINKPKIKEELQIPDRYEIIQLIALGKPAETVVVEVMKNGDVNYWRDENSVHHVPKRSLKELVLPI